MILLPHDYTNRYECINTTGATADIYYNSEEAKVYKIYRTKFNFDDKKMKELLAFAHPNGLTPTEIVALEKSCPIGYEMDYCKGIQLKLLKNILLSSLIKKTADIISYLKCLSETGFFICDPNIDNILFDETYKFADTLSYIFHPKISPNTLFQRNMLKVNETVLCGLLGHDYQNSVTRYLLLRKSKYLKYIQNLKLQSQDCVRNCLEIIQEESKENILELVKNELKK